MPSAPVRCGPDTTTGSTHQYRRGAAGVGPRIDHEQVPHPFRPRVPLAAILSACLLAMALLPGSTLAAGPTTSELRAAETQVLERINAERARRDLRPIRMDTRIQAVAEARSADMVARSYFAHVDPDGKAPWDHLDAAGIAWYGAGEIIALNNVSPLSSAASQAVAQWMASTAGHREQVLSTTLNYAGVGAAVTGSGTSYWTVVFIQGPDRTRPVATLDSVGSPAGSGRARVLWSGADRRLVTLTAGVASYDVERRRDGGTWTIVRSRVTDTSASITGSRGVRYQFRVRARDRAGNVGDWSSARSVTIR